MLLTLNISLAPRVELGRAAHFQGATNVLVPLSVDVSKQRTQAGREGLCCVWCQLLCWGKKGTPGPATRESASSEPPPAPARYEGPPLPHPHCPPSLVSFREQWLGSKQRQQDCKANLISSEGCRISLPWFYCQICLEIWSNSMLQVFSAHSGCISKINFCHPAPNGKHWYLWFRNEEV